MASIINLAALSFTTDQVRTMNEMVVKATLEAPMLNLFHDFVTGIRNDRQIGIMPGSLGLIGKAAQGCNPVADTNTATALAKTWSPKRIEVILDQCFSDLETSLLKLTRNLGIAISDLTNTEYFAYLLALLQKEIPKMIFRHAWMGNTAAGTVDGSPTGVLTSGTDPDYFNVIDGFFTQLAVIYAADSTRKTAISANAQATRALQFSAFTPTDALTALNAVIDDAPALLTQQSDRFLLVTRSVAQKAYRALQALGVAYKIELQKDGFELGSWDGIPMVTIPVWDEWIAAYENNGTKLNSPHRIVYMTKSNFVIGMEGTSLFDRINTFYDQTTRNNRIEVSDAMDAKILIDDMVQVGI